MRRLCITVAVLLMQLGCHAARAPSEVRSMLDDSGCEAYEVHLSLSSEASAVRVAWRTRSEQCESIVRYGFLNRGNGNSTNSGLREARGTAYSVDEGSMCYAPATKKKFQVNMHVVLLPDLVPDTEYWYRMEGSNRELSFRAPIRTGSKKSSKSFSFIAYGDMGQGIHKSKKTRMAAQTMSTLQDEVSRDPVHLITHVGDISYADGSYKKWDAFMEAIEPIASKIPYMVGVGNHEGTKEIYNPPWGNYGPENGGECGVMLQRRFPMSAPHMESDNAPFWYSFDYGSAHFTMISTEHDLSPGSEQYKWLARDLATVDRCYTPWLIVGLHRPMYVVYPHKDNRIVGDHIRDYIEGLLLEYKVDLTLSGHVHTYYRTCSVRQEKCVQDGSGIYHFIIGTAGHKLSDVTDEQKTWLAGGVNDYGFVRFDVEHDVMYAKFILSESGEVADHTKLVAHIYTDEECDAWRSSKAERQAALEKRLAALDQQQHAAFSTA